MDYDKDLFWYEQDSNDQRASAIVAHVNSIISFTNHREMMIRHFRLYSNRQFISFLPTEHYKNNSDEKLTLNVVKSCVDTAAAKIAKSKPRPQFLGTKGQWNMKKQMQQLQQFIDGVFYEQKCYEKGRKMFKDAAISGDGYFKTYTKKDKVCIERVLPFEVIVDETDAVDGNPSILYQIKYVNKKELAAMFKKHKRAIMDAKGEENFYTYSGKTHDMILVVEAWKRPSCEGEKDGMHCLVIEGCELFHERWDRDYFPFVKMPYHDRSFGFYSQGIAESLTGIQLEINRILKTIQISMYLGSVPKIFVDAQTKIVKAHLNNEVGGIITYQGIKPTYDQLMKVPPDLFMQLENLYQKAFQQEGLTQMSATGAKPAGLDSGKALRTYNAIETDRFSLVAQRYDDAFVDLADLIIKTCEYEAEKGNFIKTTSLGSKYIEPISWDKVRLERDKYIIRTFPTNFLSQTPEARMEDIQELMGMGLLTKEQAKMLLEYPDLEAVMEFENAALNDIYLTLDAILDKGEYNPPIPQQDLQYGIRLMQYSYLKFRHENLSQDKLEMLLLWADEAIKMVQKMTPPPPQGQPTDVKTTPIQL